MRCTPTALASLHSFPNLQYYESGTDTFSKTQFTFTGNSISQFEDGIFVTPMRIVETSERRNLQVLL
jgi:hypothetical protein